MRVNRQLNFGAALCSTAIAWTGCALADPVAGQGTWESTLQARDLNGDGTADAFYDTTLKITWLADARASAGSAYDDGPSGVDGEMSWTNAVTWAEQLNLFGVVGWRLPTLIDTAVLGCDYSYAGGTDCGYNVQSISSDGQVVYSELAHLFHSTLGNLSTCPSGDANCSSPLPGEMLTNSANFRNLLNRPYWTGVRYAPFAETHAWNFHMEAGFQGDGIQSGDIGALLVHAGDVTAVPEPTTWALWLAGGLGLWLRRTRVL